MLERTGDPLDSVPANDVVHGGPPTPPGHALAEPTDGPSVKTWFGVIGSEDVVSAVTAIEHLKLRHRALLTLSAENLARISPLVRFRAVSPHPVASRAP